MENIQKQLELINQQIKELASIYKLSLVKFNISENEFWIAGAGEPQARYKNVTASPRASAGTDSPIHRTAAKHAATRRFICGNVPRLIWP